MELPILDGLSPSRRYLIKPDHAKSNGLSGGLLTRGPLAIASADGLGWASSAIEHRQGTGRTVVQR